MSEESTTNMTQNLSSTIDSVEDIQNNSQYYIGILITIFVAIAAALVNVSAKKSIDVPRPYLLCCAGISIFIYAIIMHLCLLGSDLSEIPDIPTWKRYILTSVVALGSMIAGHLLVSANQVQKSHSLIRWFLIQSCSAGAKKFTNYLFCYPQFSSVIQNIENRCAILTPVCLCRLLSK